LIYFLPAYGCENPNMTLRRDSFETARVQDGPPAPTISDNVLSMSCDDLLSRFDDLVTNGVVCYTAPKIVQLMDKGLPVRV
jgi:hypothetical protein